MIEISTIFDNWKPFKMIKYAFIFVFEIFTFLSWLFGYVEKLFDVKAMVIFNNYDITGWTTNNYNIYNARGI